MTHTSAGEDLDLLAGYSLDLVARREDGDAQVAQDSVQRADGGVNIRNVAYLRTYKVTFTNRLDSSVPAERLGADVVRFRVVVPARGETVLTYRLRLPTN